ncbi:hypothetical protein C8P64_0041 [Christiangramia gaetbulicola]|uniref:Dolichyl-phosphate-mannose-protein mannosyltransferase n=2 Tax=Christiangramia gaetbulicola TaxID=703340 RepID=A0A2T6AJU0_9FLAO|nr:hypothetical protein C8P64_0041 [Christiangramia gaetbulicola]
MWSFNGDEVNLGLDILNKNFKDILYPFQSRQSAPPLFLLLQKAISVIAKPFISLKILNFIASCASLFLFKRLLKTFPPFLQILLLAVFCFSPFIISNSLTLKQYSLDLTLGLVTVNYFVEHRSSYKTFLFFSIFCLLSNIGLFFCAAMSIFFLLQFFHEDKKKFSWNGIKRILPVLFAPLPYLLFFIWFIQQPGAETMKNYMVGYWSGAFMPIDISIFKWWAIQAKVITIFFFSTYWMVGVPLLMLFLLGVFSLYKNRHKVFMSPLLKIIMIYIFTSLVHILLSALKMYPFSDRLFLYLAPGIYLILGYGIQESLKIFRKKKQMKMAFYSIFLLLLCTILLYFNYLPGKANDVATLLRFVNSTEHAVLLTAKARQRTSKWLEFTCYEQEDSAKLLNSGTFDLITNTSENLLIAVQSEKYGHTEKLSRPEPIIYKLLAENKIDLYHRVGGYTIYKIKE